MPRHVRFGSIIVGPARERWGMSLPILEPKVDATGKELPFQVPDFVFFDNALDAAESARALSKRLVEECVLDVVHVIVYDQFNLRKTEEYTVQAAN